MKNPYVLSCVVASFLALCACGGGDSDSGAPGDGDVAGDGDGDIAGDGDGDVVGDGDAPSTGGNAGTGGAGSGGTGGTGDCDPACPGGLTCCSGQCASLWVDRNNCGECGVQCEEPTPFCDYECQPRPCQDGLSCDAGETCCGQNCCAEGEICCYKNGGPGSLGPTCVESTNGTCPDWNNSCPECD